MPVVPINKWLKQKLVHSFCVLTHKGDEIANKIEN